MNDCRSAKTALCRIVPQMAGINYYGINMELMAGRACGYSCAVVFEPMSVAGQCCATAVAAFHLMHYICWLVKLYL